jgi:hypothetical protein
MESVPREVERRVRTGALYIVTGGAAHGSISACARCDISLYTSMFKAHPAGRTSSSSRFSLSAPPCSAAGTHVVRALHADAACAPGFIHQQIRQEE